MKIPYPNILLLKLHGKFTKSELVEKFQQYYPNKISLLSISFKY